MRPALTRPNPNEATMMNPFKLALCLAIPFALAACSGGGGSGGGGELTVAEIMDWLFQAYEVSQLKGR